MNILFLCHRIPYPPNKGDKIRSFHEIKHLSQDHNLYLAFLVDDERDLEQIEGLKDYCIDYRYDVISPQWQKIKALPYLMTSTPLSVPYFYSVRLQEQIDRLLDDVSIDGILCFSSPVAEYVFRSRHYDGSRCGNARLVMDFVDVDSDKWRMYAGFSSFPWALVYQREWKRLQEYEKKVGEAFDWSIFVSDKEVELFKSFCDDAAAVSVANGVDTAYFGSVREARSEHFHQVNQADSATILFMGAMDYFPNEDAVLYFVAEIWPLVKKEIPYARFVVVGGKPSQRVTALAEADPAIVLTGYVPDVRPYLTKAAAFVAPFRIARGIQNKVLEAMAAGVPVVARPESVQGLKGFGDGLRVEESSQDFATALIELIADPEQSAVSASDSERFIATHHNWGKNLQDLERLLA
ncbi:MAG: TIGR03087 family PEP-CTERM/XrtA system glycosyltransferase [Desulfuromonadales bacterium]|nr:MAG: TIGR03087 family PEP-CTERM/XrtA system glycosyltransferase [Desulfuromonadales bacterium]